MPVNDALGTRMKEFYEQIPKTKLMRRCPVAIRIDGKAFHTFTRGFQKPFDEILMKAMQYTTRELCKNIQGCVFGYTQSDEITLILVDYQTLETSAWFDYEVQKLCSVTASMATMYFNKFFRLFVTQYIAASDTGKVLMVEDPQFILFKTYSEAIETGAMFDARCFNIPKEEVTNLIYWRQLDATRNSIQMVGQANFTHKELQGKTCNDIQDMLFTQRGINWNDFPTSCKRGTACIKKRSYSKTVILTSESGEPEEQEVVYTEWAIDTDMPILKGEGRKYVDDLIYIGE